MAKTYPLSLTRLQISALLSLLVDHSLVKDSKQEWEDVVSGEVVTLDELLTLFSRL